MGNDNYSILLSQFYQWDVLEVGMHFDLEEDWLDFADCEQLDQQLPVEVADCKMLGVSLVHERLHLGPEYLERLVVDHREGGIDEWPVQIDRIEVLQLHKGEGLFDLCLHIGVHMVEDLGGYEQLFPFSAILVDDSLYGFAEWYLIIVVPRGVNMPAISLLQSFPQHLGDDLLVLQLVCPESQQRDHLFVGQGLEWRPFLLLLLLLFGHLNLYNL